MDKSLLGITNECLVQPSISIGSDNLMAHNTGSVLYVSFFAYFFLQASMF